MPRPKTKTLPNSIKRLPDGRYEVHVEHEGRTIIMAPVDTFDDALDVREILLDKLTSGEWIHRTRLN